MIDRWDATGIAGAALVVAGVAFIYWPAALVLCGAGLLYLSYLGSR